MESAPSRPSRRITQDDVAQRAGVTRSVVSYVLNGNSRAVAPDTRDRVLKAIEDLGYRPNQAAQSLGLGHHAPRAVRQIGIVLPSVDLLLRPYYTEILAGIHLQAHEANYHIRFIRFFEELRNPILFNSLIHDEAVGGLLLIALDQAVKTDEDRALVDQIEERIGNIVCLEWQREGHSSVFFDRQEAAAKAVRHLVGLGHTRLAYIGEADERILGFRQALATAGLAEPTEASILFANDPLTGFTASGTFLDQGSGATALVAGSDEVAFGILRQLGARGIAVPGRVSVVSIDNIALAEYSNPPLTTVSVQKSAMGRRAVQMVIDRDRRPGNALDEEPVTMLLPTTLVVRLSCGPAP